MSLLDYSSLSLDEKVNLILNTVTKTSCDLAKLTSSVDDLRNENQKLQSKINILEKQINTLETQSKQNYLIFYGIREDPEENQQVLEEKVINIISNKMNINISNDRIETVSRLGGKKNESTRPTAVKFHSQKCKTEVLRNAKSLTSCEYSVALFYSKQDQEKRLKLKPFMEKAKNNGDKAYIKNNNLVFNNRTLSFSECEEFFKHYPPSKKNSEVGLSEITPEASGSNRINHKPVKNSQNEQRTLRNRRTDIPDQ